MKSYDVTIQMKALCLHFHMVLLKIENFVKISFWLNLTVKGLNSVN